MTTCEFCGNDYKNIKSHIAKSHERFSVIIKNRIVDKAFYNGIELVYDNKYDEDYYRDHILPDTFVEENDGYALLKFKDDQNGIIPYSGIAIEYNFHTELIKNVYYYDLTSWKDLEGNEHGVFDELGNVSKRGNIAKSRITAKWIYEEEMTFCIHCEKNVKNIEKHLNEHHNSLEVIMSDGDIETIKYNGEELECIESDYETITVDINSINVKKNTYVSPYEKIMVIYGINYFKAFHIRNEDCEINDITIIRE